MGGLRTSMAGSWRATPRADLVSSAFGTWMIIGLFTDGWAHLNLPGLESFFTPWHAVLYSGFGAAAAWLVALARRGRRTGLPWSRALPVGYRLAAVGVALFGAGGVADMVWHLAFGVEVGVDALLSPTHLLLLTGAALMLTAPLRSVWGRPPADGMRLAGELPAVVSLVLVTALAAFFLLYASVFTGPAAAVGLTAIPEGGAGHEEAELPAVAGLAGYLVTTVLLVVPLLLAQRVGRRPRGTAALLVGTVAWLSVAVAGFAPEGIAVAAAVTVAGALVDLVQPLVDRSALRPAAWAAVSAALVPALVWPAQLMAVAATVGVRWPVELWSGVVVLSALVAATLGVASSWTPAPGGRVEPGGETVAPAPDTTPARSR